MKTTNHINLRDSDSAENSLLDQRLFFLNDTQWIAFQEALNRPAEVKPSLKQLMEEKAPWE